MRILNKNILVEIGAEKELFEDDHGKCLGKVVGIGEKVEIEIKDGDEIYFHPSSLLIIPDEKWSVISESSVICKKEEVG